MRKAILIFLIVFEIILIAGLFSPIFINRREHTDAVAKFFDKDKFPWYRLDNVGDYTYMPYKVLWREQSKEMTAVVVSKINDKYLSNKTVVTDWIDDLEEWNLFCENPKSLSSEKTLNLLLKFLMHVPCHIAAASKLLTDEPVKDIFNINATSTRKI